MADNAKNDKAPRSHGTRNDSKLDPEDFFEGDSRKEGPSVVNQTARELADVPPGAGEPRYPDETRTPPDKKGT